MLRNLIALLQAAALPIIIVLMLSNYVSAAFFVLLFVLLSDAALEYLFVTKKIGSFLRPFADKITVMGTLLFFVLLGAFPWYILAFFVLRDVFIIVMRWLASRDDVLIHEEWYRKLLIYMQFGILFGLLGEYFESYAALSLYIYTFSTIIAVLLAALSIFHHLVVYIRGVAQRRTQGRLIGKEHMLILANTRSRGYKDIYRRHLLKIFARRRKAAIVYLPVEGNILKGTEKTIGASKHVVLAGGDGTFESALNYTPLRKKSLGFFPLGAGNAFYAYFYKGKRFEYLRSRFQFQETELDILEVTWERGRRETTFLSAGLDADVVRLSDRSRHGFRNYVKGSVKTLMQARGGYDLKVAVDGKTHNLRNCVNLTIGKVPFLGFALRSLLGRVQPDDGFVYALATVNTHSSFLNKPVRLWGLILAAFGIAKAPLLPLRGKQITVKGAVPFPLQAGGEFLGESKWIKVRVKRKQKVLMI